jgi:hypothetical protein
MVPTSAVLAERALMIRLDARFQLTTDDFKVADEASDALLDALMLVEGVFDPDVAVSMTEHLFEVWLYLPTDNAMEAYALGSRALATAFATASFHFGADVLFQVTKNALNLSTELVTA